MKKSTGIFIAALFLALIGSNLQAFAECGGANCPWKKGGHSRSHEEEKYACPITNKLMRKGHFYLQNQTELGLSDEQVAKIKQIKYEAKKTYIRQMAEMQVAELDMQHAISQTEPDVNAIHAMIDQHAASMSQGAKDTVSALINLKAVLTPEQTLKAKELWMEEKK